MRLLPLLAVAVWVGGPALVRADAGDKPRVTEGKKAAPAANKSSAKPAGSAKPAAAKAAAKPTATKPLAAKPVAKPPVEQRPPEVLFTFDDGPHLERTPKVLEVLAEHHIKAVFFVNGVHFQGKSPAAERSRELLREILRRGHAVGNHTINHKFLCGKLGPRIAEEEIEGNARLIEQATGVAPELYRTPYGAHCATLSATLGRLGIKHTGWDIDPQDWKVLNTNKVRDYVENYFKHMHGRQILLMHDIHQDTVEALPQILDWLDKENAARARRGDREIKVIDYSYLLPPHPAVPPILDGIGRVLLQIVVPQQKARWLVAMMAGALPRS